MKKTLGLFVALVAMFVPTIVNAATELPEAVNGVIALTEDVTLNAGFVVKSNETITLDTKTFTLTTAAGLKADTIYVEKGGKLTIKGSGTIEVSTKGYAALFNNGTIEINGSTLKRDVTDGNDWYVILNHGIMTINDATVSVNGTKSSLVDNGYSSYTSGNERSGYVPEKNIENPTLTINGGLFDGGMNTIKNDDNAILTIKNGTFQNNYQVAVMNWNIATIDGGNYKTPTGIDKTNLFVGSAGAESVNKGILVINGGTFEGEHVLESKTGVTTKVEINGGVFKNTEGFVNEDEKKSTEKFLAEGAEIKGNVEAPKSALKYAVQGATITVTDAKIGDTLTAATGVVIELPADETGELTFDKDENGNIIVVKSADLTKLLEIIEKIDKIKDDKYTEESLKAIAKVLEDNAEYFDSSYFPESEQAKIDAITKALNDAYDALVEKSAEPSEPSIPEEPEIDNPKTGDSILLYVAGAVISICGIAFIAKSKRFN